MHNGDIPDLGELGQAPAWMTDPPWAVRAIQGFAIKATRAPEADGRILVIGLPSGEQLQLKMRQELADDVARELTES